jgi:hypothetical protein
MQPKYLGVPDVLNHGEGAAATNVLKGKNKNVSEQTTGIA